MAATVLVVALLLSLPFLFVLVRRPVLRRLAVRNAIRRPREATLVIVGAMLGTAIITGSFVVGDTLDRSTRQLAYSHLGPVDEVVTVPDRLSWLRSAGVLRLLPQKNLDGVLPFQSVEVGVTAGKGQVTRSVPGSQLLGLDFPQARAFGRDPAATGISGPTPASYHAAITTDLAQALRVRPGDLITVWIYGSGTPLTVDRVLPRRGVAGFTLLKPEAEANNVLVGPDTFSLLSVPVSHPEYYRAKPTYSVAVSNRGDVESGVKLTKAVSQQVRGVLGPVGIQDIKRVVLDQAKANGDAFTQLFTGMGSFGVLAGVLLLVNLFVMLAAERKPELGMARAVGMRRSWLVGGFATEGWLYALAASILGTLAGIGLGRLIIAASARMFSTEHSRFDLLFTVRGPSVVEAFAIGFLIALLTVIATSVRISRLNIIAAIRDLPDMRAKRRRRRWLVLGALGAAVGAVWTVSAIPDSQPLGLLLGPTLVAAGLCPFAARLIGQRKAITLASALVAVWGVLLFVVFPDTGKDADMAVWVTQGVTLTGATVVLIAVQQERVAAAIRKLAPGRGLALRLGLAYPLARRSRTGLTVAMYALVVFILTFITTLSAMIGSRVDGATKKVAGGYAVVVKSSAANPIPISQLAAQPGVRAVAALRTVRPTFTRTGTEPTPWNLTAFDQSFFRFGRKLYDRGAYPNDRAAWEAVLHDPRLVIVDENFLSTGGGPGSRLSKVGDRITVTNPETGRQRVLRVAALAESDVLIDNGALYGLSGARSLFGRQLVPWRAYVALDRGVNADEFAASIQGGYLENGAEASSIRSLMQEAFSIWDAMFQLFQGYLGLGLIVGIAGLAVVMVRAVRERRRQIGMLRALGFGWRTIGRSFAIESGFIAVEGTVIGAALALLTISNIVANTDVFGDMRFTVPWISLLVLLVGTVAASLLATTWPAIQATRIKPAVALRTTD